MQRYMIDYYLRIHYFRICFGLLMVIYSANKCTDNPFRPDLHMYFDYESRLPSQLYKLFAAFPWYSNSLLYWRFHGTLMLLSAVVIVFTNGFMSRFGCLSFSVLKMALLFQDQSTYNNHEYMYGSLALVLSLCDCHRYNYSLWPRTTGNTSSQVCSSVLLCVTLVVLMLINAVYGIPGWIAVGGVCIMWLAVASNLGGVPHGVEEEDASKSTVACDVIYLQIYFAVVYFYAGLAKTNTDWLSGFTVRELLTRWVGEGLQSPPAGWSPMALPPLFSGVLRRLSIGEDDFLQIFALCGLLLDLFAGWLLMAPVPRLRCITTVAVVVFNTTNHWLFVIETFPWVMMSSLVLYHDATWMGYISRVVQRVCVSCNRLFLVSHFSDTIGSVWRRVGRPFLMGSFLFYHLLAPLQCGLSSVADRGAVSWSSSCQNFNWRMMSRSGATVASSLRFKHPVSGDMHVATLDKLGRELCAHSEDLNREDGSSSSCSEQREFLSQTPQFEDRLHRVVLDAVARSHPRGGLDCEQPLVFADIWLEINGPPIQRFVRPYVDLAAAAAPFGPIRSWGPLDVLSSTFSRPQSPAWLLPRVEVFRSMEWLATLRDLVRREVEADDADLEATVDHTDRHSLRVLFVTDYPSSGVCYFFFHRPTVLRLLHGMALVQGVGAVRSGEELRVEGRVAWQATEESKQEGEEEECALEADGTPALWMIVFRGDVLNFEIQPF